MTVHYQIEENVVVVTIDRVERRNAIDRASAEALGDAWRRFDEDPTASVAVLHGANGVFSAGADLVAFDLEDGENGFLRFTRMAVSKPTIAAIAGHCVAGGLEMALWCDLRFAAEDAVFGCFERRWGVPLVDGGTQRLPRLIGQSTRDGHDLDRASCRRSRGLRDWAGHRLVPSGSELVEALALAYRIARFPQATIRSDRAALPQGVGMPLRDGLQIERGHGLEVFSEARAGASRFSAGAGRHGSGL